jgi:hypothetical protein
MWQSHPSNAEMQPLKTPSALRALSTAEARERCVEDIGNLIHRPGTTEIAFITTTVIGYANEWLEPITRRMSSMLLPARYLIAK